MIRDISKRIVIGKLDLSENRDKIVAFSFPDEPEPPPPEEVCPFPSLPSLALGPWQRLPRAKIEACNSTPFDQSIVCAK